MIHWKQDTWCRYLPHLHRHLAAPEIETALPPSFVGLSFEDSCSWWETLRYLFRSLLGWRCLPTGLAWWYAQGKPDLGDARLRLVLERWNARSELDYFAAREWEMRGWTGNEPFDPEWQVEDFEPAADWLRTLHARPCPLEHSPYGGGSNPMHLGHSDLVGEASGEPPVSSTYDIKTRRATLITASFGSWRHALQSFGASLPLQGKRSWHVTVFDREVGHLGTFRQSRETGLWFQGAHSLHMAGNAPSSSDSPADWWPMDEDAYLVQNCALRFDGEQFERDMAVRGQGTYPAALQVYEKHFKQSFDLLEDDVENMAVFFLLQRAIKWHDHLNPRDQLVYVRLFLHLHDKPVPRGYDHPSWQIDVKYGEREQAAARALAARLRPHLECAIATFVPETEGGIKSNRCTLPNPNTKSAMVLKSDSEQAVSDTLHQGK